MTANKLIQNAFVPVWGIVFQCQGNAKTEKKEKLIQAIGLPETFDTNSPILTEKEN